MSRNFIGASSYTTAQNIYVDMMDLNRLSQFIQYFGEQVQLGEGMKHALYEGGKYIMKISKSNLRESMKNPNGVTGNLLKSYKVTVKPGNKGVLIGFDKNGHHSHLVDHGHEIVVGEKKIHTGKRSNNLLFHTKAATHLDEAARIVFARLDIETEKKYQNWAARYNIR